MNDIPLHLDDSKRFSTGDYSILYVSLAVVCIFLLLFFDKALPYFPLEWAREEYSHGYLIPLISLWLVWENRVALRALHDLGSWYGPLVVAFGLLLGVLGNVATLFTVSQYAVIVVIWGFCLAFWGAKGLKLLWFPLTFLDFMIPIPRFLYNNLSSSLQLISSDFGVAIIRLFDISVNLEGNVIDLGTYQLQVVDACSGLRYLFPLASFGFLCAYFFRAPFWMRALVFLSTMPITIFMNSFRIAVIGILVDKFGISQAEGFLHDFEGWVIFVGCLGILIAEMWLLTKYVIKNRPFVEVFVVGVSEPDPASFDIPASVSTEQCLALPKPYFASCLLLIFVTLISLNFGERDEIFPSRKRFVNFPLTIADWHGKEQGMDQKYIDELQFEDYILADYSRAKDLHPVNFYVAYYKSQRRGASAHSPKSCIPGDGWQIESVEQKVFPDIRMANNTVLSVNRLVISKGNSRQLVYYWFQQRGRVLTNEYLVKWYLMWDSIGRHRTDGAMIRLVVPVNGSDELAKGDQVLGEFLQVSAPLLHDYVPE